MLVTSAFMMVVSFILIPNPVCSLWVAFSIMSIEVGGLMMMMMMYISYIYVDDDDDDDDYDLHAV